MISPATPENEEERLQELLKYELLDTLPEANYNEIVELASAICEAPISLISLVDSNRQWFKAKLGMDASETPRTVSFCGHAIHEDGLFEVPNALEDERFHDNPLVTENPNVRFYAGMPLETSAGHKVGTLCVMDEKPRLLTKHQKNALQILGRQVMRNFELRAAMDDLRKTSKQLIHQKELIEQHNAVNKRITSILAHDVKDPLQALEGILKLAKSGAIETEELPDFFGRIASDIVKTRKLIQDILQWGHYADGISEDELVPINLYEAARGECERLTEPCESKGIVIELDIDPEYKVLGKSYILQFAFRNLLFNAMKYSKSGTITASAKHDGSSVQISVSDNGPGISPLQIEEIFNLKQNKSKKGTAGEEGAGVGLILLQELLHSLHSKLEIKSTLGEGATFYFKLPYVK